MARVTCPFTTDSPCSGDLAPLRIPELERAVRERFPNGRWWVDMIGKGDWTWDPYPYENYDPTDPDGPARPDNDLSTLLNLPGMFLLEPCPTCRGGGNPRVDTGPPGTVYFCPNCEAESGYRKALVCERHRVALDPASCPYCHGERPDPDYYRLGTGHAIPFCEDCGEPEQLPLPPSLYQEPNRVLARELGLEVA